ncbi:uncharacterized protein LOC107366223 [Tetranychus urticae]|uniref:Peptidase M28 domain-containing protein n=1 Tax=Tetranychus urticae TaxID=32264 RepID=T1KQF2_TETUR|nr:uncharacterized protein LOC107366223 [Tetranychus urticae]XP_025017425.1 uncharacterized protein LOC107366223 [Tetranychus urticae]XP_025017426.1 uncharacterized protein LOC107366223 [Tetranychus urticae]XP_025017427.1 uncharacterized protein LOC107366223 [Tetranychus urticae]
MLIIHRIKLIILCIIYFSTGFARGRPDGQVNHDNEDKVGGNHDGDSDIDMDLINFSGIRKNDEHTRHILANLMDPNPVDPSHNGSLIISERLIAKEMTGLTNRSQANLISTTTPSSPDELTNFYAESGSIKGADIEMMKKTLVKLFSKARSHEANITHKELIRSKILDRLSLFTSETFCQEFTGRDKNGAIVKGVNIIGILPGRLRGEHGEGVMVIGAHYDTVATCPGMDDNGSGAMAVLESARILSSKMGDLNHTIIFVTFDLEELGALGSIAFVNNYLIPKVLNSNNVKFLGAYIMDMILNYDPSVNAQVLPRDISRAAPEAADWVRRNNNMGDFVAIWTRRKVDWHLWYTFEQSFNELTVPPANHKILVIDPPIPRTPILFDNYLYRNFMRSDHASFWNHKSRAYKETLHAVLITDMGPWRGVQRACYHEFCDDESQLTTYNLEFVKHIIDALVRTVVTFTS